MNVSVIYYSRSGNTAKIAQAAASACGVEAIDIAQPHVLPDTDLLFVGMGIYGGKPGQNLLDYLDNLPANRIHAAAVFSTSASGKDRMEPAINLLKHKEIEVYPVHLRMKGKFLFFNRNRPNKGDLVRVQRFAEEVLKYYSEESD